MELVTISTAFNPVEAQLKRSRLEAAGFHPFVANEASALWIGYRSPPAASRVQVPEFEAADAREFLNPPAE